MAAEHSKPILQPGPEHPITIEATGTRVVVSVAGRTVADTREALTLREADYQPVQYIPLADVDQSLLRASDHTSYCPYKGDCAYYSIAIAGEHREDAVWTYPQPYPAVAHIDGHVAFYPDRVDAITT